jgi:hypothetical protein
VDDDERGHVTGPLAKRESMAERAEFCCDSGLDGSGRAWLRRMVPFRFRFRGPDPRNRGTIVIDACVSLALTSHWLL